METYLDGDLSVVEVHYHDVAQAFFVHKHVLGCLLQVCEQVQKEQVLEKALGPKPKNDKTHVSGEIMNCRFCSIYHSIFLLFLTKAVSLFDLPSWEGEWPAPRASWALFCVVWGLSVIIKSSCRFVA